MPLTPEVLEITTVVGCAVHCTFCPQSVIVKAYGKRDALTLENFKVALKTVPKHVVVGFTGFSEPFLNPHTVDMMEYASAEGYKMWLFSTLVGLRAENVKRLAALSFEHICLHLPDNLHNATIPSTPSYRETLDTALRTLRIDEFSVMNANFVMTSRAGHVRNSVKRYRRGFFTCHKLHKPQFVMIPNCDVVLCCMDYELRHKLGNLIADSYHEICCAPALKKIKSNRFHLSGRNLCRDCSNSSLLFNTEIVVKHFMKVLKQRANYGDRLLEPAAAHPPTVGTPLVHTPDPV